MSDYKTKENEPIHFVQSYYRGLTKREYFATSNLNGLLASGCNDHNFAVQQAVKLADLLIDRLNK